MSGHITATVFTTEIHCAPEPRILRYRPELFDPPLFQSWRAPRSAFQALVDPKQMGRCAVTSATTQSDTDPATQELPPIQWERQGDSWISNKPNAEVKRVGERHWGRLKDQWLKAEDGGHAEYQTADEGKKAVRERWEKTESR